jgi:hypothetical protein
MWKVAAPTERVCVAVLGKTACPLYYIAVEKRLEEAERGWRRGVSNALTADRSVP